MQVLFGQQITAFVNAESETWALTFVETDRWGGLVLTLALAVVSITASFPIGVLLALGRRSDLPVIRVFCIGAIEFVRGVPLITILFMASIMVPLLSPALAGVDSVVRAMIGMTFFSAAYVAEIVRGGLQAIPGGQAEAAKAVGLSGWQTMLYIILPQALRAVIPALVGQFISLFKDTSLVFIIGLIELLGVARAVINEAEFIGTQREALVFIGIIYFIGSYAMSYASRRIEESGAGAVRRI
jgi:general L-amino acid transport system permease protein